MLTPTTYLENLNESLLKLNLNTDYSTNHLSFKTKKGTYLINKYRNELWLSSPLTGPAKYISEKNNFFNKKNLSENLKNRIFSELKKEVDHEKKIYAE